MAFASVLGHQRIKELFEAALRQRRLRSALLLAGPDGVGKKMLALEVGRALVCQSGDGEPCGRCAACSRSARGIHPDLQLVVPEGNSIKIEQVREVVREILGRPFEARARAFVIDDAHLMTEQAANALLKSLEEPPPTSHVFLVTASPQALLPTIRSRCQTLRFSGLPLGLIETHLRESSGIPAEEAHLRAQLSGGSLRAAFDFEADAYRGLRDSVLELLENRGGSVLERMAAADRLAEAGEPALALTGFRSLLRDVAALSAGAEPERLLNADLAPRLSRLAAGPLGSRAGALAEAAGEARAALEVKANKQLTLDALLDALAAAGA